MTQVAGLPTLPLLRSCDASNSSITGVSTTVNSPSTLARRNFCALLTFTICALVGYTANATTSGAQRAPGHRLAPTPVLASPVNGRFLRQYTTRQPLHQPITANALAERPTGFTIQAAAKQADAESRDVVRADGRSREFQAWAQARGIQTPKLTLATFAGLDGVMAKEDVRAKEVIISIPKAALITTTEQPEPTPPPLIDAEYWRRAHYTTRLAFRLLEERRQGPASAFQPYVAVLPSSYPTPFFWDTPGALEELQYPPIQETILDQRAEWRALFEGLQASSPDAPYTWEDFAWALSTVRSRSYRGEFAALWGDPVPTHCLLPWIDMINSRSRTPTAIAFNGLRQRLELRAGEAFPAGTQVWLSYDKPNDDLLQFYGYVERDNPDETFCLTGAYDLLVKERGVVPEALAQQRLEELRGLGLLPYLDLVCVSRNAPYLRSAQALRVLLAPEGQAGVMTMGVVVPEVEREVYRTLSTLGERAEAGFPTTLEDDEAELPATPEGPLRLALAYRVEKKRVLGAFLDALAAVL